MSDLTRRRFVRQSAAGVAGVATIGALTAGRADARGDETTPGGETVVAYVKDPRTGEIAVLSGDREVTVHDRGLAAQIARAAR